jgi:squalene-hopene/tetraprenyl-beta-curcumene cyclase
MTSRSHLIAAVILTCSHASWGDDQKPVDVRAVIQRSLPYIEKEGVNWMEAKKCDTCHHVTFMTWSLNAAADRGIEVDPAKLAEWNEWARDWRSIKGRDNLEGAVEADLLRRPDEVPQLLLGRRNWTAKDSANPVDANWPTVYRDHLLESQQADGSWKPGGQLPGQKRPLRETTEATTLWAMIAIQSLPDSEAAAAAREKAAAWLGTGTVGQSTDWWAAKLLWEQSRGNLEASQQTQKRLLEAQREDGGWGWLIVEDSDALGTGPAIYALLRSGVSRDDATIQRAIKFLSQSQTDDGSWKVRGTKQNKRNQVEHTSTYWGTCWAVIGLAETLPRP